MAIEIIDWAKHYENNRTRELKHMAWVPMPNRHDGDGFTRLMDHPNGLAHFGAWCLLVEVASRCDARGTLLRRGGIPILVDSLARMTHTTKEQWDEVLPRLVSIGWITGYEIPQEDAVIPQEDAPAPHPVAMELNGTELNGMELNGTEIEPRRTRGTKVPPSLDLALYHSAEEAFLSRNDGRFTDYPKEGAALKGLVKKARARAPDAPDDFLLQMITAFWGLRCNGNSFWQGQPFTPSALNASAIWDRVLETMRNDERGADPVAMAVARGETV